MRKFLVVVTLFVMFVFPLYLMMFSKTDVIYAASGEQDMGMHIASPLDGATINASSFIVQGMFDTAQSGNFKLVVTVGTEIHTYPFTVSNSISWGPITIRSSDFSSMVTGDTYSVILQAGSQMPLIPPLQTTPITVKWNSLSAFTLKVNVSPTGAGSVTLTPSGGTYAPGTVVTLTATPSIGYKFDSWSGDLKGSANLAQLTMDSSKTITANFSANTYSIFASAGSGGTIIPAGTVTVNAYDAKIFTITPDSGYKIKDVKVDGASIGVVSTYTFKNVTSNHTIEVSFEKEITETIIKLTIGSAFFTVNGETRVLDSLPIIKNSRTLLPIRAIVEALGGAVDWDNAERKVTVALKDTTVELWIGKPQARVNGSNKWIDDANHKVVPEIINSRTMLPLRFVAESLGATVDWDQETKTITITYRY